jgi:hypothetical protein
MADKTTDVSVVEQLSLCVRYLDVDTFDVQEDFLGFVAMNDYLHMPCLMTNIY